MSFVDYIKSQTRLKFTKVKSGGYHFCSGYSTYIIYFENINRSEVGITIFCFSYPKNTNSEHFTQMESELLKQKFSSYWTQKHSPSFQSMKDVLTQGKYNGYTFSFVSAIQTNYTLNQAFCWNNIVDYINWHKNHLNRVQHYLDAPPDIVDFKLLPIF